MATDLHLHTYGRGPDEAPALVLFHGFSDSGPCWADAIQRWQDRYHVVAVDARGHGLSPRFTDEQLEDPYQVMLDDAVAVLTQVRDGTGRPSLVAGHSMGASVSGYATARAPHLIAATVLEDPPWWLPVDGPSPWERAQREREESGEPAEDASRGHGDAQAPQLSVDQRIEAQRAAAPQWPDSELHPWAESKDQLDQAFAQGRGSRRNHRAPWTEAVAAFTTPVLLVTGTGNVLVTAEALAEAERLNPLVRTLVVDGADHCVRRDRGDAFHAGVDPFLAEHAPTPR